MLRINRATLYRKLEKFNLENDWLQHWPVAMRHMCRTTLLSHAASMSRTS
jgi:hypothetical protein